MTPSPDKSLSPQEVKFENALLKKILLEHLNSIYCGKQHFIHFFEEIKTLATLHYLKDVIQECSKDAQSQILRMDGIFNAIGQDQTKISVPGMKAMTLEAHITAIRLGKTPMEGDFFIVFYLQLVEDIEVTYFNVLKNLAKAIVIPF